MGTNFFFAVVVTGWVNFPGHLMILDGTNYNHQYYLTTTNVYEVKWAPVTNHFASSHGTNGERWVVRPQINPPPLPGQPSKP